MLTLDCKCISDYSQAHKVVNELRDAIAKGIIGCEDDMQRLQAAKVFDSLNVMAEALTSQINEQERLKAREMRDNIALGLDANIDYDLWRESINAKVAASYPQLIGTAKYGQVWHDIAYRTKDFGDEYDPAFNAPDCSIYTIDEEYASTCDEPFNGMSY